MIVLTCFLYDSSIMLDIFFILISLGVNNDTAIYAFMGLGMAIVFHFFFVLDIVGAIMLNHLVKEESKANTIEKKQDN